MTLAYSSVQAGRVQILSDGAHYLADGTLTRIASKIHKSEVVPLVVVPIGNSEAGEKVADAIVDLTICRSFDMAIALASRVVAALAAVDVPKGADFGVIVAGISETRGPCHFVAFSRSPSAAIPSFRLVYPGTNEIGNIVALTSAEMLAVGLTPAKLKSAGPALLERFGLSLGELMRAKRQTNFWAPDLPPQHIVGGMLELTTISAVGIETQTLATWPDVVGEKIQPTPAAMAASA